MVALLRSGEIEGMGLEMMQKIIAGLAQTYLRAEAGEWSGVNDSDDDLVPPSLLLAAEEITRGAIEL